MSWPSIVIAVATPPVSDERGHVTVLTIGLMMVVLAVTALAVDGTRFFIERRALQSAADAAAVAAATEVDVGLYHRSGGTKIGLDPRRAEIAATRLLGERGIDAAIEVSIEGKQIGIWMSSETETSWLKAVGITAIPVSVQARARPFPQVLPIRR